MDKQCCLLKVSMFYSCHHHGTLRHQQRNILQTSCSLLFLCKANSLSIFQANASLQDGCDSHSCRVNERGEFIWERRITGCPPFDARRCLAEGVSSEMGSVSTFPNGLCHVYGNPNPLPTAWLN